MAGQETRAREWGRSVALAVGGLVIVGGLLGFVVLPLAQGSAIGLDFFTSICRALGILPGTPAAEQPASVGTALPVSQVAWSADLIDRLQRADPAAGAATAEVCAGCHGERGVSPDPLYPHLAGQSALALYKQLDDFRTGSRVNDLMSPMAEGLDAEAMINVAAHYSALTKGTLDPAPRPVANPAIANLVLRGDSARGIPACVSCHSVGAGGPIETPTIAGQLAEYLAAQLDAYAAGTRRNDVYGRMRHIAGQLTGEEKTALAEYYSTLRTR